MREELEAAAATYKNIFNFKKRILLNLERLGDKRKIYFILDI